MTREQLNGFCDQVLQLSLMAMLLMVPLAFFTFTHDVFETNKLTVYLIFVLLALLAALTRTLVSGFSFRPSPLQWPLAAVGLTSLLATLWSNNRLTSIYGVYEDFEGILTIASYLLLWVLVHQHVRTLAQARKFLGVVAVAGALAAGYGVAQNFGMDFILWNPNTYTVGRLFGSLGNPNFLSAYVLMALPITAVFFFTARDPQRKGLMGFLVLIMLVAIFFTKSRGALYGLAAEVAALAGYLIYDTRRQGSLWRINRAWFLALALLAGLTAFSPQVRQSLSETVTRTLATFNLKQINITPRLYIWRSALYMIRDHPLLGVGLDTFQITFPQYRLPEYWALEWNGTPEKAHNFFLQIGATTGLLGLSAWFWLLIAYFVVLVRQLKRVSPERRHWTAGVGIAQIGFLVQNQFNFTVVAYGSLFWFLLALGPSLEREEASRSTAEEQAPFTLEQVPLTRWLAYLGASLAVFGLMVSTLRFWAGDLFFKRGMVYMNSNYVAQALPELQRATQLNPGREIYWVKLGIAYEEQAKGASDKLAALKQAESVHLRTIGMNPLNGYDFNNLGRVYKFWGDFIDPRKLNEAEKACRRASELDPYNVYFALDLASVLLSQRRWPEVMQITDRLIATFPDFAMPYSFQGYIYLMQNDIARAQARLQEACERNWRGDANTQASSWSNLGIVRARHQELEGAVQAFQAALKVKPQYLEARLNLALVQEQRGNREAAAQEYRYILQQAPTFPGAAELKRKLERWERGTSR